MLGDVKAAFPCEYIRVEPATQQTARLRLKYAHMVSALKGSDGAVEQGVPFINLMLSGALTRCDSLLDSHLIAQPKPGRPGPYGSL